MLSEGMHSLANTHANAGHAYEDAAQRQERMRLMNLLGGNGNARQRSVQGAKKSAGLKSATPHSDNDVEVVELPDTMTKGKNKPKPRPVTRAGASTKRKPGF